MTVAVVKPFAERLWFGVVPATLTAVFLALAAGPAKWSMRVNVYGVVCLFVVMTSYFASFLYR